ncbi:MAG TPA: cytochrome P450 [Terracidiphilus sp.]|nr:cytochrome P450 [Terracidiphilus sp.]
MSYTVEHRPGITEFIRFRRHLLSYLADAGTRGIDIVGLSIGSRLVFQVNHPDLIHDILIAHDWNFVKGRALRASKPVLGDGLLTSEGELHRRQRRLVQPAFHSQRLAAYASAMVECADIARRSWSEGSVLAIDQEMMRLTLQIVGRTLFSADMHNDASGVGDSLTRSLHLFLMLNSPLTQLVPPLRRLAERRASRARAEIAVVVQKVIDEHREHPDRYDDMLSMLLRSTDEGGTGYMSDELLLDESLTLFLAGHETTANALTWTWYLLAQHEDVADELYAEIDRVLAGRLPTLDDIPQLAFTSRVFHEALRIYPPAWVIGREAVTEYRLGDVRVPASSTLVMSPFAMHRDPRFWPDPERFDPGRWKETPESSHRPRFAFFPFGAGTRACIGEHFAMMESVLLLATLAQRWRFHLVPGQTIELWPQITLRPRHSVQMRIEAQSSPAVHAS